MHDGDPTSGPVLGTCDMSLMSTEIRLTFGDLDSTNGADMAWEIVRCRSEATANDFELALPSACWRSRTGII